MFQWSVPPVRSGWFAKRCAAVSDSAPGSIVEREVNLSTDSYSVLLERDMTFGALLNRGVPDTVLFVFTAPASDFTPGDEMRIGLTDGTPEEADLYEGTRWINVHTAAEVVVTLRVES